MSEPKGKPGLPEVLELPYFYCSARHYLDLCLALANENVRTTTKPPRVAEDGKSPRVKEILELLDKYAKNILGEMDWKAKLSELHNGQMTHYQEFLAFQPGGCDPKRKLGTSHNVRNCQECRRDRAYDQAKPSSLLALIRNVHEHAPEKMQLNPNGVIKNGLFPNGYSLKQAFVEYWMGKFPKLFPLLTALHQNQEALLDWSMDCVPDQAVHKLRNALDWAKNRGKLVKSYVCKLSDGKQFHLDVFEFDPTKRGRSRVERDVNKVVKVWKSYLFVQHKGCPPLKYNLTPTNREAFNVLVAVDLLEKENCINTDRVVLLIESNEMITDIENSLRKFAVHTLESELKQYVDRWLIRAEENVDQFAPQPDTDTAYLILARDGYRKIPDNDYNVVLKTFPGATSIPESKLFSRTRKYTENNIFVLWKSGSTFKKILDKFKTLCDRNDVVLIQYSWDYDTQVTTLSFLTPECDLLSNANNKLVFISAGAGEGKTSLLEHILYTSSVPETTVVHTTAQKLLNSMDGNTSIMEVVASSVAPLEFQSDNNMLLILIDAMDEVDKRNLKHLQKILKDLAEIPNIRVVASMRSYLDDTIKNDFQTSQIFKLAALADDEKLAIVRNYCHSVVKCDTRGRRRIGVEGFGFVAKFSFYTHFYNLKLTPLYCRLLGEIWMDLVNRDQGRDFTPPLSETGIYEKIVEKNFHRYLSEKKKVRLEKQDQDIYQRLKEEYIFAHVYLALKQLYPQLADSLKAALEHPNVKLTSGQGFLNNVDPVIFSHRSIAEYFVDYWVSQVLLVEVNLNESDFCDFFMLRYFQEKQATFLNEVLQKRKNPICLPFELNLLTFEHLASVLRTNNYTALTGLLLNSFVEQHRDLFVASIKKVDKVDIRIPCLHPNSDKLPIAINVLLFCARYGIYDTFSLIMDMNVPIPCIHYETPGLVQNISPKCPFLLRLLLRQVLSGSSEDSIPEINEKKKIIEFLLRKDLSYLNNLSVPIISANLVSFDLFKHLIYIIHEHLEKSYPDKELLDDILLRTDNRRQNILHGNSYLPDFIYDFRSEFGQQFYQLANSIDRIGCPYWVYKCSYDRIEYSEVDVCIRSFDGHIGSTNLYTISSQISVKISNGTSSRKELQEPRWRRIIVPLQEAALVTDRVLAKIDTGASQSLLDAFESVAESETQDRQRLEQAVNSFPNDEDELSPYYVALYIRDRLFGQACSDDDDFQDFLLGTVLATEGIKFKHAITCHLINDLIANEDITFTLSEKHGKAMCVNDSAFIVACKTAHVSIAKLLGRSFSVDWISCLNDFQVMCFFRALEQHCGNFLQQIVAKLADHQFVVPIYTVQESLITGNMKLFKFYVEQLGFTNVHKNVHLVLENSRYDHDLIKRRKKNMILYIRKKFQESFVTLQRCKRVDPELKALLVG